MEDAANRLEITEKLEKVGLDSPRDLLTRSLADLQRELSIKESAANELLDAAASDVYPWRSRLSSLKSARRPEIFSTGDESLDQVLGGGVPIGSVTEVVGESSSGKTQFCLQLCLAVQKPAVLGGIGGRSVYLHSEGRFPATRLDQLASRFSKEYGLDADEMKRSIYTMHIPDREAQHRILCYQLPALLEQRKSIGVVVVDSISAHYRGLGSRDNYERMAEISEMGSRLKKIAHQFNVAVVAVNQVADTISKALTSQQQQQQQIHHNSTLPPELVDNWMDFHLVGLKRSPLALFWNSLSKKPVLGFSWANSVTTRIRLARSPMMDRMATKRALFIETSPLVSRQGCLFEISIDGIQGTLGSQPARNKRNG